MDLHREQPLPLPLCRCDERSARALWEHKTGVYEGFSKKYKTTTLIYYEFFHDIEAAIAREKQLKGLVADEENRADRENESRLGGTGAS